MTKKQKAAIIEPLAEAARATIRQAIRNRREARKPLSRDHIDAAMLDRTIARARACAYVISARLIGWQIAKIRNS